MGTELCWLNGEVIPLSEARVSVEDRGFLFADGVYEAFRLYRGKPFGLPQHLDRLERSCAGIELTLPMPKTNLASEIEKLIAHSGVSDGLVYLQITRGPGPRNHVISKEPRPTTMFYIRALPPVQQTKGYVLLSVPDERWKRCWIKSIGLLANTLARTAADRAGADEAVFVHERIAREGSSCNLFAVIEGKLVTHPLDTCILGGITRDIVLDCARQLGIPVEQRAMTLDEGHRAEEVFLTSSIRELMWVKKWDDAVIGAEGIGPITRRLHEEYRRRVAAATA